MLRAYSRERMAIGPTFRLLTCLIGLALAGCAGDRARDPFSATGELVALSGGDAGARRACIVCHGLNGQGDGELTPRLAGLPPGYLAKQLRDYADGRRINPQMESIARALEPRAQLAVAGYYGALAWAPPPGGGDDQGSQPVGAVLYHRGAPERGIPACASCHGDRGQGGPPANPPLAGQPAGYLNEQMELWRVAKRRNDPLNVMLEISRRLTPAEAEAVSRYSAGLRATRAGPTGEPPAAPAASL